MSATTNQLRHLLERVEDEALRRELATQVEDLLKRKNFGLVFEEHLPELLPLPNVAPRVGSRVIIDGDTAHTWTVEGLSGQMARLARGGGDDPRQEKVTPSTHLTVVKRFGEAIYPKLEPIMAPLEKAPGQPFHTILQGDNYHALQMLLWGYQGAFDVIYIDPPYNTGARDWKYNNDYVDGNDRFRHSKWLSMMKKRLLLAKHLLKNDGVLVVTIDEHEVVHLGMLLETIFPAHLRYMVTVVTNPKGTGKANFSRVDEQLFFLVPDLGKGKEVISGQPVGSGSTPSLTAPFVEDEEADQDIEDEVDEDEETEESVDVEVGVEEIDQWEWQHARRRGAESSYRDQRWNQFYPIYIDEAERKVVRVGQSIPLDEEPNFNFVNGLRPIWPIDKENNHRVWRFISESMQSEVEKGNLRVGRYDAGADSYTLNIKRPKKTSKKLKTVWWEKSHDAGTHGTSLLIKMFGKRKVFPFPKSIYAVRDSLAAVIRNKSDALILDFFAGSGTTLHATLLLNASDQGHRRCILVTNNDVDDKKAKTLGKRGYNLGDAEWEQEGICQGVTIPRCAYAINGHRADGTPLPGSYIDGRAMNQGFAANLCAFKIDFLDPSRVERGAHFKDIAPILWLMAGAQGSCAVDDHASYGPAGTSGASKGNGPVRAECYDWWMPSGAPLAVLLEEHSVLAFEEALALRAGQEPTLRHVFVVTDASEAFNDMERRIEIIVEGVTCTQLYRKYLENFRLHQDPAALVEGPAPVEDSAREEAMPLPASNFQGTVTPSLFHDADGGAQ